MCGGGGGEASVVYPAAKMISLLLMPMEMTAMTIIPMLNDVDNMIPITSIPGLNSAYVEEVDVSQPSNQNQ